jgi:hypothetical protein
MIFRYRYVGFGTTFESRAGDRPSRDAASSWLYENEIALDVGSTCWDTDGEILPIIDHHFQRKDQFPSASVAVLHKAALITEKFAEQNCDSIWLVSHHQPDFDAFCSMYLVRWILEHSLSQNSLALFPIPADFDWFRPKLQPIPVVSRWPFLLASYASHVDNGRRIACSRPRALHSILYAALQRGRDYQSVDSGATEFFDDVRQAIQEKQLNPLYDSVLEGSTRFQPELVMLESEVEAYQRDVERARKSIVHLQKGSLPFHEFFTSAERVSLLDSDLNPVSPHISSPQEAREHADAIALKDPECLLFKEWARLDIENSSMGMGFTFTAVAYSGGRSNNGVNQCDYFFALDPERANGRHLYGLWARLEAAEVQAMHQPVHAALKTELEEMERAAEHTTRRTTARLGFERRAAEYGALFSDPWFDGSNYAGTIIATPNRGTFIDSAGKRTDLLDDPIMEIVRKELEYSTFTSPLDVQDLAATSALQDGSKQTFEVGQRCLPPKEGYFRLAKVALNEGVDIFSGKAAEQIGETLWRTLYPENNGGTPTDFLTRHLVLSSEWLGIWSRRGIVIAYKPNGRHRAMVVEKCFQKMVSLAKSVEQFIHPTEEAIECARASLKPVGKQAQRQKNLEKHKQIHKIVETGEQLTRDASQLTHELTLPDNRLLSRFFEALGLRELLAALRDLNLAAADKDRQSVLIEYAETVTSVQVKLELLEVLIFTVYGAELGHMLMPEHEHSGWWVQGGFVLGGALLGFILGAIILKPDWDHFVKHWRGHEQEASPALPADKPAQISSPHVDLS